MKRTRRAASVGGGEPGAEPMHATGTRVVDDSGEARREPMHTSAEGDDEEARFDDALAASFTPLERLRRVLGNLSWA